MTIKRGKRYMWKQKAIIGYEGFHGEVMAVYGSPLHRIIEDFFVVPENQPNIVVLRNYINKHTRQISRPEKFLGKVTIEQVEKTRMVIRLLPETINELKRIGESYGIKVLTQKEYHAYLQSIQNTEKSGIPEQKT